MIVRTISHKGLRRLIEEDDGRGVSPDIVKRVRHILASLVSAKTMNGVSGPPGWRIHQLVGDRDGSWSISASGNWRITFRIEANEIYDLSLEDYH